MFKRLVSLDDFGPVKDKKVGDWFQYRYIIVDSEFTEEWVGPCKQRLNYAAVRCGALISCYESKGQNVAYQLMDYHKYMVKQYYWYNLEQEIHNNILHTPMYGEYAPVIQNYMKRYNNLKAFW